MSILNSNCICPLDVITWQSPLPLVGLVLVARRRGIPIKSGLGNKQDVKCRIRVGKNFKRKREIGKMVGRGKGFKMCLKCR